MSDKTGATGAPHVHAPPGVTSQATAIGAAIAHMLSKKGNNLAKMRRAVKFDGVEHVDNGPILHLSCGRTRICVMLYGCSDEMLSQEDAAQWLLTDEGVYVSSEALAMAVRIFNENGDVLKMRPEMRAKLSEVPHE